MQLGECVDTVEDPSPQDVSQVEQRYKAAVKEARRKGVNVSAKEQHIFDQLHKMLVQYISRLAQIMHEELFTCTKLCPSMLCYLVVHVHAKRDQIFTEQLLYVQCIISNYTICICSMDIKLHKLCIGCGLG